MKKNTIPRTLLFLIQVRTFSDFLSKLGDDTVRFPEHQGAIGTLKTSPYILHCNNIMSSIRWEPKTDNFAQSF